MTPARRANSAKNKKFSDSCGLHRIPSTIHGPPTFCAPSIVTRDIAMSPVASSNPTVTASSSRASQPPSPHEWPEDWPVQAHDPLQADCDGPDPPHALHLGPALRQCSGSDIYLTKTATASTFKHVFAILPGLLSLNKSAPSSRARSAIASTTSTAPNTAANTTTTKQSPGDDSNDEDDGNDAENSIDQAETADKDSRQDPIVEQLVSKTFFKNAGAAPNTKPETVLGEWVGWDTDQPILNLRNGEAPSASSVIQFQGQRIPTQSKFLVLTLQPKKKRVICKHVFDSVVVFGQVSQTSISTVAADDTVIGLSKQHSREKPKASCTRNSCDDDDDDNDDDRSNSNSGINSDRGENNSSFNRVKRTIHHYGASLRCEYLRRSNIDDKDEDQFAKFFYRPSDMSRSSTQSMAPKIPSKSNGKVVVGSKSKQRSRKSTNHVQANGGDDDEENEVIGNDDEDTDNKSDNKRKTVNSGSDSDDDYQIELETPVQPRRSLARKASSASRNQTKKRSRYEDLSSSSSHGENSTLGSDDRSSEQSKNGREAVKSTGRRGKITVSKQDKSRSSTSSRRKTSGHVKADAETTGLTATSTRKPRTTASLAKVSNRCGTKMSSKANKRKISNESRNVAVDVISIDDVDDTDDDDAMPNTDVSESESVQIVTTKRTRNQNNPVRSNARATAARSSSMVTTNVTTDESNGSRRSRLASTEGMVPKQATTSIGKKSTGIKDRTNSLKRARPARKPVRKGSADFNNDDSARSTTEPKKARATCKKKNPSSPECSDDDSSFELLAIKPSSSTEKSKGTARQTKAKQSIAKPRSTLNNNDDSDVDDLPKRKNSRQTFPRKRKISANEPVELDQLKAAPRDNHADSPNLIDSPSPKKNPSTNNDSTPRTRRRRRINSPSPKKKLEDLIDDEGTGFL